MPLTHGTLTGYTRHGCRCAHCTRVACRYDKQWRLHQASGKPPLMVDAQPVHDHIHALLASGMSFNAITKAAGYKSRNSLTDVLTRRKLRRATAEKLLAITLTTDTRPERYIPAIGSMRRLQALAVLGHSSRDLASRLGHKDHSTVLDIQNGHLRSGLIRATTAEKITALYNELWNIPGSSPRTTRIARTRGWLPPQAWDDDTIDNGWLINDERTYGHPTDHLTDQDILTDYDLIKDTCNNHLPTIATRLGITTARLTTVLTRR